MTGAVEMTEAVVLLLYSDIMRPRFPWDLFVADTEYMHLRPRWLHCWHLSCPLHLTLRSLQASQALDTLLAVVSIVLVGKV